MVTSAQASAAAFWPPADGVEAGVVTAVPTIGPYRRAVTVCSRVMVVGVPGGIPPQVGQVGFLGEGAVVPQRGTPVY